MSNIDQAAMTFALQPGSDREAEIRQEKMLVNKWRHAQ